MRVVPADPAQRGDLTRATAPEPVSAPVSELPRPKLSVVVAMHDEAPNLPELHRRLSAALAHLDAPDDALDDAGACGGDGARAAGYELLFVDDGSRDASAGIVASFVATDPHVKLVRLSRNFGQQAALAAGLEHARGAAVVLMDADLQDPPELLPEMFRRWEAGADVVYAVRRSRREHLVKRACYRSFYRLVRWLAAPLEVPLDSGDFSLLDRRVVDAVLALSEQRTFLRGLRSWVGFRQEPLPYERPARFAGTPAYTFAKLRRLAVDGIVVCSSRPLRLASVLGFATLGVALLYLVAIVGFHFVRGTAPDGWTSVVGVVLVLGGAQLAVLGVLAEYLARVVDEVRRRPDYVVASRLGFGAANHGRQP